MLKESIRGMYGKRLLSLGEKDKNIIVLDADLAKSTKTITFGKQFPDRFIDMGLSEQDMVSTAAGIALTGKTVFASSFCTFLIGRAYDQIRQSVCYNKANVKLVGTHSGLGVGEDGATHQSLEDLALTRALPELKIIVPADIVETAQVIDYVAANYGPYFVRLTRNNMLRVHKDDYKFKLGQASLIKDGDDIAIFAIGIMLEKALDAAGILKEKSIEAAVINFSSLKPFDQEILLKYAQKTRGIITVEDHSVYGGLGSTIAEYLSQNYPAKIKIMGIDNQFGKSGKPENLFTSYNLTPEAIADNAVKLLE